MATPSKPSFSRARKWSIGFNVALAIFVVFALVVMVNYLSSRYFQRLYFSTRTRIELSAQTVNLLHAVTNQIHVTLYYSKDEPLYADIAELLKEYHANNPKLTVETVDYDRDPGLAQEIKSKYNLGASTNKNLIIFDCGGNVKIMPGNILAEYTLEQVPNETEREFRRKPVAFRGEMMFTAALLAVTSPKPLKAYFLQGHGEHRPDDGNDQMGYLKFATVLQENHIQAEPLSLLTNAVPADCNLLIIAGPKDPVPQTELDRIDQYLNEGGRLLALFNAYSVGRQTGLEKILAKWGVSVADDTVKDPDFTTTTAGTDVVVGSFANHPVVNPLLGSQLQLILPHEITKTNLPAQSAEAPLVEEIAFSGPHSYLRGDEAAGLRRPLPLMVAVERNAVKGVVSERGATRMLIVGDSIFLGNRQIDSAANRDFASYAVNWLLERNVLLQGLGPRPVTEYRLIIARKQMQTMQCILLGAMPGGILLLGGLVWLRRRR